MKANKKLFTRKDTRAQVGIGTLIIFIAMVLVAAVAAAVLIQTSGVLQQKAQATGKQATQEVSSNLIIKNIEGVRAKTTDSNLSSTIDMIKLRVGLNVGSAPVDINQVVISITDGTTTNNLIYAANDKTYDYDMANFSTSATATVNLAFLLNDTQTTPGINAKYFYTVEKIRDEDASFTQEKPVLNTGDLVTLYISSMSGTGLAHTSVGSDTKVGTYRDSGLDMDPRATVSIILTPEAGATTVADFVTPSSYGTKETVQLYP
ncbi:MAG: flagellin [Methanosarcinaceae archaeon]|nr:flagellin [Methanosarcinaceae archaeon]